MSNVYLLACALLNSVDDYLRGPVYRLPHRIAALPFSRVALKAVHARPISSRCPRRVPPLRMDSRASYGPRRRLT